MAFDEKHPEFAEKKREAVEDVMAKRSEINVAVKEREDARREEDVYKRQVHGDDRAHQEHDRQRTRVDEEAEHVAQRHALDVVFRNGALHKRGVQQSGEQSPDRAAEYTPVSYTHLDVYKRQPSRR